MNTKTLRLLLGANWKTNLLAIVSFVAAVPQAVVAGQHWLAHQPADWRGAAGALLLAAISAAAKDGSNRSTSADVADADAKAGVVPVSTTVVPAVTDADIERVLAKVLAGEK